MRVTSGMIMNGFLTNLNANMQKMDRLQYQMATGKRISRLSDDPTGVISVMQANTKLYKLEQYQKNCDTAQAWVSQSESSVMEMNEVVKSAYEASINAANDFMNDTDKKAIANLIGQLRDHLVTVGNAKMGDRYIFGGYNTNKKPFTVDAGSGAILYNGLDLNDGTNPLLITESQQNLEIEIGSGLKVSPTITGAELMGTGPDNIYSIMDNLYKQLNNDASPEDISVSVSKLQQAQSDLLTITSDLGGRTNRMDWMSNRYEDDFLSYTEMKSTIEDADQAEVYTQYKMAEAVYLAALQSSAGIIQPTLLDFLK